MEAGIAMVSKFITMQSHPSLRSTRRLAFSSSFRIMLWAALASLRAILAASRRPCSAGGAEWIDSWAQVHVHILYEDLDHMQQALQKRVSATEWIAEQNICLHGPPGKMF